MAVDYFYPPRHVAHAAQRGLFFIRRVQNAVSHRLMILSTAMKRLLGDENFVTLLRAESIQDIPSHFAERME